MTWDEFLIKNHGLSSEEEALPHFLDLKSITLNAIDTMSNANMWLRKCELCGGYFKARSHSTQTCCSRIYRDTKATCYEYSSRKSYKDKQKEHPIYQEYIKTYNRLYGRIRRKKVPVNSPLIEQLIVLRDEYYGKYNAAPDNKKKSVLDEYAKKNTELLG